MYAGITIKLISEKDIIDSGCINYNSIINTIENAFKEYVNGRIMLPDKISQIFDESTQDRINCMPSTLFDEGICGVKWVSVFPRNPHSFGIPNVSGLIVLSEIERGYPFAVIDGTLITALRTACMGAIGAKYLAKSDSCTYGTIGTGIQAQMHFRFIKHLFPSINTCYISSRTQESEERFAHIFEAEYPDVTFVKCNSDYSKASINTDIIVTAVSCQKPLLKAEAIKEGAYYCHVGGWEDEYAVPLKADKIVCDDWYSLKHRGSPTLAKMYEQGKLNDSDIYGNIGELICGIKPGRESEKEFNYFNAIGLSFVDVAVAYSFYKKVLEFGRGIEWRMT